MRAIVRLIGLGAFEAGTLAALGRMGELSWMRIDLTHLRIWLAVTPGEDVLAAVARILALVCTYWLTGSTILYVLARAGRFPTAVRSLRWLTLPAVRRLADRALAVTLATSTLTGAIAVPGWARPAPPQPPVSMVAGDDVLLPPGVTVPRETEPHPTVPSVDEVPPLPRLPYEPQTEPPERPAQTVVRPGDNHWTISRHELQVRLGTRPGNGEVARYWHRVIELNRPRLMSGDPDLIYPGEIIELPPGP